jgi:3-dehydroquinate synthase
MTVRQIVLIGLSGVGKTTVGTALAARLDWRFIDTDDEITKREGKSPADILTEQGEPAFRKIEESVIADVAKQEPAVIATGGGAFLNARSRRALGERGFICFLDATPTEIARRIRSAGNAKRPLLGDDASQHAVRLADLDAERRPYYDHADLWVPAQGQPDGAVDVEPSVRRIIDAWAGEAEARVATPGRLERLGHPDAARGPAAIVDTGRERYPVWVGAGEYARLADRLRQVDLTNRRVFLISDADVMERHGRAVAEALDAGGIAGSSYIVPPGEASKNTRVAEELYAWLAGQRAERRDVIMALGGGVVTDLAGFVAATYLRGMPLVQLPTSVLGMNDAAIGGKVAVDLPLGKNLVGAFHQPRAVISDITTLRTLPRRAFVEGFAEVIKHALILDPILLATLRDEAPRLTGVEPDPGLLASVVARSSRLKALIVSSDPTEQGLRAILNYGHTIGHGIETAGGYETYRHGEAVSIGMMGAARISAELGLVSSDFVDDQAHLLRLYGLPTDAAGADPGAVLEAMRLDKKIEQGRFRFVLLEGAGRAVVRADVPDTLVQRTVRDLVRG